MNQVRAEKIVLRAIFDHSKWIPVTRESNRLGLVLAITDFWHNHLNAPPSFKRCWVATFKACFGKPDKFDRQFVNRGAEMTRFGIFGRRNG